MADAPVLSPVTAETVEAHMRDEHCPVGPCRLAGAAHRVTRLHDVDHDLDDNADGTPAFGHTHSEETE